MPEIELPDNRPTTGSATLESPRHEAFAQRVAKGWTQWRAYGEVYNKKGLSHPAMRRGAIRVMDGKGVRDRVAWLQAAAADATLLTVRDRYVILAKIARSGKDDVKVRAIGEYNKMAGDLAPEKTETTLIGDASSPVAVVHVPHSRVEKIARLNRDRLAREARTKAQPTP